MRRLRALELRKAGLTYREIARELQVDVHTAYADVVAELLEVRQQTAHEAADVRDIEIERCDVMIAGLWPAVQAGNAKSILAAVKVSERRARLLGLDAATSQNLNVRGGLSLDTGEERKQLIRAMEDSEITEYLGHAHAMHGLIERVRARLGDRS